jgi:ABC-type transport system substrate-binding protein
VVFAAAFFAECGVNPITCPAVNWNPFSIPRHVLPRAMQFDAGGNLVGSDLLVEAPTLENGGLTQGPFTVRFKIRSEAVWDDGSPITSADFDFTWRAFKYTTRPAVYERGYDRIRSIDVTDQQIAAVEFNEPFAQWGTLFGGADGYLLKKTAFPDADPQRPDLAKEMRSDIPFSGGPFKVEHADVGTVVLVRNERYFGMQPYLDKVTFVNTRPEDEASSILSGRSAAVLQQGDYPGVLDQFKKPNIRARASDGTSFETLTLTTPLLRWTIPRYVKLSCTRSIDERSSGA